MTPIIFDLDGTLIDCRTRHYTVYSRTVLELGGLPLTEAAYWRRRRNGMSTIDVLDATPEVDAGCFREAWMERIEMPRFLKLDQPFGGTLCILDDLRLRHRMMLITLRREREPLVRQLEILGLDSYFSDIISCGPDAESKKYLLPGAGNLPPGGYAVGDTEADIQLGRDTGRAVVCVANGVRSGLYLAENGAGTVIRSLRELPEVLRELEGLGELGDVAEIAERRKPRDIHARAAL